MIVDFHTHVMPPWVIEEREALAREDPCFRMLYGDQAARIATVDDLITSMDEAGIEVSVVLNIGWAKHDMCVRTNDYLLEAAARWPGRVLSFCMVQPTSPDLALRELERCAHGGAFGIGELRPDSQGYSLTDTALLEPLATAVVHHQLVLLTHVSEPVGHLYPGKGTITPEQPYAFARAFPAATLVCAHWGGGLPFYALMPEVADALANVYFDTAASHYLYRPDVFETASRLVGSDRILFGSDYPLIRQRKALEKTQDANLCPEARQAILGHNAMSLIASRGRTGDE